MSSSSRGEGKKRDPGNEVATAHATIPVSHKFVKLSAYNTVFIEGDLINHDDDDGSNVTNSHF